MRRIVPPTPQEVLADAASLLRRGLSFDDAVDLVERAAALAMDEASADASVRIADVLRRVRRAAHRGDLVLIVEDIQAVLRAGPREEVVGW